MEIDLNVNKGNGVFSWVSRHLDPPVVLRVRQCVSLLAGLCRGVVLSWAGMGQSVSLTKAVRCSWNKSCGRVTWDAVERKLFTGMNSLTSRVWALLTVDQVYGGIDAPFLKKGQKYSSSQRTRALLLFALYSISIKAIVMKEFSHWFSWN